MSLSWLNPANWKVHCFLPFNLLKNIRTFDQDTEVLKWDTGYSMQQKDRAGNGIVSEWDGAHMEAITTWMIQAGIKAAPTFHWVTLEDGPSIIQELAAENDPDLVVFNPMDGTETDGWPGLSIIKALEATKIPFSGAAPFLYAMDQSKADTKAYLTKVNASTPRYADLVTIDVAAEAALKQLTYPVLIKPALLSGSLGLFSKSVVSSATEAIIVAKEISVEFGAVYAEEFISGREFTVLVVGNARDNACNIKTFRTQERVFRNDLHDSERFLSKEMKWGDNYGLTANEGKRWWLSFPEESIDLAAQAVTRDTFMKINGSGYCRMDLRQDSCTGVIYVVDVNPNCSINITNDSSFYQILQGSGVSFADFFTLILRNGIERRRNIS